MIVLFTDYGRDGPYIGQVESILFQNAPRQKVINLFADAPIRNPRASAYLLSAHTGNFPEGTIFFSVVDPGVGNFKDKPVVLKIDQRWFVGPDNGLFDIVARRGREIDCWEISWRPQRLSKTFHGRDLYAHVCAMLANGKTSPGEKMRWTDKNNWPDDLAEIVYIDHFGNAMTGIRAEMLHKDAVLNIGEKAISNAATFSDIPVGQIFWYSNSNGLIELAVNQASAERLLQLQIGQQITIG